MNSLNDRNIDRTNILNSFKEYYNYQTNVFRRRSLFKANSCKSGFKINSISLVVNHSKYSMDFESCYSVET